MSITLVPFHDGDKHSGLTPELCKKLILHSQKECQKYINDGPMLSGTLANLKHGALRSEEEILEIEEERVSFPELEDGGDEMYGNPNHADVWSELSDDEDDDEMNDD